MLHIFFNFSGSHFVCARYDPAGNMLSDYPENVFPPQIKKEKENKEQKDEQEVKKPVQPTLGKNTMNRNITKTILLSIQRHLIKCLEKSGD